MEFKRILIAVDSSPVSLNAAKIGIDLAQRLSAIVALIYVIDRRKEISNADIGLLPGQSEMLLLKQAEDTLDQIMEMYKDKVAIHHFTPEGFPKEEIIHFAEKWGANFIVMGTHGRKGIENLLTGSVAEYVVKHASVPVIVIPPKF